MRRVNSWTDDDGACSPSLLRGRLKQLISITTTLLFCSCSSNFGNNGFFFLCTCWFQRFCLGMRAQQGLWLWGWGRIDLYQSAPALRGLNKPIIEEKSHACLWGLPGTRVLLRAAVRLGPSLPRIQGGGNSRSDGVPVLSWGPVRSLVASFQNIHWHRHFFLAVLFSVSEL